MGQTGAVALFADGPLWPCRLGRASPGDRAAGIQAADLPAGPDRYRNALAVGDVEGRRVYRRADGGRHLPRPVDAVAGPLLRRQALRPRRSGRLSRLPYLAPALDFSHLQQTSCAGRSDKALWRNEQGSSYHITVISQ